MQEKYVSSFLDKRNRKFKKPWGNKILIKYNSGKEAKNMLEGSRKDSPAKTELKTFNIQSSKSNKTGTHFSNIGLENLTESDAEVVESMKEEGQNEGKYYEIMCKNEKINLFLKDRKK